MILSLIAAVAENGVIGKDNDLVWKLPDDFKYFKQTTSGHPILMGRKTFEALGKPLPNRTNIVITRNTQFQAEDCVVVDSLDKAVEEGQKTGAEEIFVIGGAEIYHQALPMADLLYLTDVKDTFEGDTYFPDYEAIRSGAAGWKERSREPHAADERHAVAFDFVVWERK